MRTALWVFVAAVGVVVSVVQGAAAVAPAETLESPFTREPLAQMLAPIALYPDTLLAQILVASTYPLELVEADRWRRMPRYAALNGDQLAAALQ